MRWFMRLAHRFGWHKMDKSYPHGDTMLWCHWCGIRIVTKTRKPTHSADNGGSKWLSATGVSA